MNIYVFQIALFDRPIGLASLQVGVMIFIGMHKAEVDVDVSISNRVLETDKEEMSSYVYICLYTYGYIDRYVYILKDMYKYIFRLTNVSM